MWCFSGINSSCDSTLFFHRKDLNRWKFISSFSQVYFAYFKEKILVICVIWRASLPNFHSRVLHILANLCLFLGNIVGSGVMFWNSLLIPLSWERNKNQVGKSGRVLTEQKLDFVSLNAWRCFVQIHILIVCRLCTGLFSLIYPKQVNIFLSILQHVFFLCPEHFIPSIWFFLSNVLVPSLEDLNFIVLISIVCAHLLIYT